MKNIFLLLAILFPLIARADGIDLKSGDYFMEMDSGNIVNLDTGEYFINMGSDKQAPLLARKDKIIPLPTSSPPEIKPEQEKIIIKQTTTTGDYYMKVEEGILNLTTGNCYMKLE